MNMTMISGTLPFKYKSVVFNQDYLKERELSWENLSYEDIANAEYKKDIEGKEYDAKACAAELQKLNNFKPLKELNSFTRRLSCWIQRKIGRESSDCFVVVKIKEGKCVENVKKAETKEDLSAEASAKAEEKPPQIKETPAPQEVIIEEKTTKVKNGGKKAGKVNGSQKALKAKINSVKKLAGGFVRFSIEGVDLEEAGNIQVIPDSKDKEMVDVIGAELKVMDKENFKVLIEADEEGSYKFTVKIDGETIGSREINLKATP